MYYGLRAFLCSTWTNSSNSLVVRFDVEFALVIASSTLFSLTLFGIGGVTISISRFYLAEPVLF